MYACDHVRIVERSFLKLPLINKIWISSVEFHMICYFYHKHTYQKYSCLLIRNTILKRSLNPNFNLISEITDICL